MPRRSITHATAESQEWVSGPDTAKGHDDVHRSPCRCPWSGLLPEAMCTGKLAPHLISPQDGDSHRQWHGHRRAGSGHHMALLSWWLLAWMQVEKDSSFLWGLDTRNLTMLQGIHGQHKVDFPYTHTLEWGDHRGGRADMRRLEMKTGFMMWNSQIINLKIQCIYTHTLFHSARKKDEVISFTENWIRLEMIILGKVSHIQTDKHLLYSHLWVLDFRCRKSHTYDICNYICDLKGEIRIGEHGTRRRATRGSMR